jgi:branched-chain amino acid transport system permease protein
MNQLIANALLAASIYALIGTGFSLIYRTSRFFHFAHGLVCAAGAYASLVFAIEFKLPLFISSILAIAVAISIGLLIEIGIYRPLRSKKSSSLILLLASLGIYIVGQNVISLVFGDDTKILRPVISRSFSVLGAKITAVQFGILVTSVLVLCALVVLMKVSKFGLIIRAVSADHDLARTVGVDVNHAIAWSMALGSGLAGLAGILIALDVNLVPTMGMHSLLMSVVAVIVGGIERTVGAIVGALLVGLLQHFGVWQLPTQWQDLIVFSALIVFLLLRPQGFLGRPLAKATV